MRPLALFCRANLARHSLVKPSTGSGLSLPRCHRFFMRPQQFSTCGGLPEGDDEDINTTLGPDSEGIQAPLQPSWSWVPPRAVEPFAGIEDSAIPVIKKQLLSLDEIVGALKNLGGENVVEIEMADKIDTITHSVIVTGNSRRHLRKMSDVIVSALKSRDLRIAPGFSGAEGADADDWLLVDCYDSAVHFMLAETREALKLEEHLLTKDKPYAKYSGSEEEYEKEMDRLLELHPVPENYNVQTDFSNSTDKAMKKKKKKQGGGIGMTADGRMS